MWQQMIVTVAVVLSALWLLWTLILPRRAKQRLAGRPTRSASGGCGGCALSERGCPSSARHGRHP